MSVYCNTSIHVYRNTSGAIYQYRKAILLVPDSTIEMQVYHSTQSVSSHQNIALFPGQDCEIRPGNEANQTVLLSGITTILLL